MWSTSGGGGVTEYMYARDASVARNTWTFHHLWNFYQWRGQTLVPGFAIC